MKTYKRIKQLLSAINNCEETGKWEWHEKHSSELAEIMFNAPSGSGFDNGTTLDENEPISSNRLVFKTAFHHMNDTGFYVRWTEHKVIVTPSLEFDFVIEVTGKDYRDIKEYIADTFYEWLNHDTKKVYL